MSEPKSKNAAILADFTAYCEAHPELRFWQALRNWSGYNFVEVTNDSRFDEKRNHMDTFYWEGKDAPSIRLPHPIAPSLAVGEPPREGEKEESDASKS